MCASGTCDALFSCSVVIGCVQRARAMHSLTVMRSWRVRRVRAVRTCYLAAEVVGPAAFVKELE